MLKIKKLSGKKLVILLVCLALAGSVGYFFWQRQKKTTVVETVKYAVVEKGALVNSISTTGKISSNKDIDIKCKASGEIIDLPHDVSDVVKKGTLLLKLNPIDEQQIVK